MFENYYQGKKVLVTGHTGFKGAWLCQWLHALGAKVAGISNEIPTDPSLFEALGLQDHMQDIRVDIRDYDALSKAMRSFKPDIVFHLAAQAIVGKAFQDPVATYATNLMGTVHVVEAVRQLGTVEQLILITSDKCYHNVEWCYGYREDDRLGGNDPYSASKACAETAIHSYWHSYYKDSDTRLVSTRAGNVIGGGDWAEGRIVPDCIRTWAKGEVMTLRSPHATRPWQHVLEPLSGYLWLGVKLNASPHLSGESFNFGPNGDTNHSVSKLVSTMQPHWEGARYASDESIPSFHEAGLLKLNCDKAMHHLQWQATCSFEETVAMTMAWYTSYQRDPSESLAITASQIESYQRMATSRAQPWAMNVEREEERVCDGV